MVGPGFAAGALANSATVAVIVIFFVGVACGVGVTLAYGYVFW